MSRKLVADLAGHSSNSGPGSGRPRVPPPLVELHCHLVPAVDDGAPSLDEALRYLREFDATGIRRVVTTPHLPASYAGSELQSQIERAFERLADAVATDGLDLELGLGYEIRLDEPDADLGDGALGVGEGGRLLVEFPQLMLPPYPDRMLDIPRKQGWELVLAHPERYDGIERAYGWIPHWREAGVIMAPNLGSLWGEYGPSAERVSRRMLSEGHADILASDHHARPHRSSTVRRVWDTFLEAGHEAAARLLVSDNPAAVLDGSALRAVPAVDIEEGWFGRLRRLVRGGAR